MIREELPSQNNEKINNKEKILSDLAFRRFAGAFELYQEFINRQDSPAGRDLIFKRIHELYKPMLDNLDERNDDQLDETQKNLKAAFFELISSVLRECEEGKFDINNFAEKISASPLGNLLLAQWNRQAEDVEQGSGMIYVNELYAYQYENDNEISVHISPSNTESKKISQKIEEGERILAKKLRNGEVKADKIIMKSWLLGKAREARIRLVFGKDIIIEDVPSDDEDCERIQFLAMQYNHQSLKKYLETGNKPEVRQIIMTKDEFLKQFS